MGLFPFSLLLVPLFAYTGKRLIADLEESLVPEVARFPAASVQSPTRRTERFPIVEPAVYASK
jgi:hypothetical protein